MRISFLILGSLALAACATPPLATPSVAVVKVLPHLPTDAYPFNFDDPDKVYLTSNGVPETFFVKTDRGWGMTELNEIQAADILFDKRNPGK